MPRPISQANRQKQVINSGFLDLLGDNKQDFEPLKLDAVADSLISIAADFIERLRDNLQAADAISSGGLADSIVASDVIVFGNVYKIEISLASFYDFVNQGVKGWQDEKGGNSPYQFKKTRPSPKMALAIRKWVIKEGLKGRGKENGKQVGIRDQRRQKISDTSTKTAYAISSGVKKKGLRPTHFFDKSVKEMEQVMQDQLGAALKIDIINSLTGKP